MTAPTPDVEAMEWAAEYIEELIATADEESEECYAQPLRDKAGLISALLVQAREAAGLREGEVDFYEREFYPLSNFSAFTLMWWVSPLDGYERFDTSEAAYHYEKFICQGRVPTLEQRRIAALIKNAPSAHEAFKIAETHKHLRRADWDDVKIDIMRGIIRAKAEQHEYVRRKLLETRDRPLIEGSWRDNFWGVGPNRDGQNMLGKLWMELRDELRRALTPAEKETPND